jgi:hypothetical protein
MEKLKVKRPARFVNYKNLITDCLALSNRPKRETLNFPLTMAAFPSLPLRHHGSLLLYHTLLGSLKGP